MGKSRRPGRRISTRNQTRTAGQAADDKTDAYRHPTADTPLRPDVGTQAQFKKKKPPATYRYDSSLSPALDWDGQNGARGQGEWLLAKIEESAALPPPHRFAEPQHCRDARGQVLLTVHGLEEAVEHLKRLAKPFLNWAGKAERLSFDVPTLPLFVHERLSTEAIIKTLTGHRKETQTSIFDLFADPQHPVADQVLRAYEHRDKWVNRLILGDSLVVMNSLLEYEGLGGQVQMIYMDPPYGVRFGSNFQPFVRKRDVKHNEDDDFTREPEMVQAYRDTWEVGLHSYLTYMRDRLLVARELLHSSGSIFVQISDENPHVVRGVLDEVFGEENFFGQVNFRSMTALGQKGLACVYDYVLWYAKDAGRTKFRPIFVARPMEEEPEFCFLDDGPGSFHKLSREELFRVSDEERKRIFKRSDLTSSGYTETCTFPFEFEGKKFRPRSGKSWRTHLTGVRTLIEKHRLFCLGRSVYFRQYHTDSPLMQIENSWHDTAAGFSDPKTYVVQTNSKVPERCLLMTTDPGDLLRGARYF
jgi:adenine-specific DNA-methyltransferase